jgi:hypothetical protein
MLIPNKDIDITEYNDLINDLYILIEPNYDSIIYNDIKMTIINKLLSGLNNERVGRILIGLTLLENDLPYPIFRYTDSNNISKYFKIVIDRYPINNKYNGTAYINNYRNSYIPFMKDSNKHKLSLLCSLIFDMYLYCIMDSYSINSIHSKEFLNRMDTKLLLHFS